MVDKVKAFIGGILFTLVLVIVIPVITTEIIQPVVVERFGSLSFGIVSSSMIISGWMLLFTFLFTYVLGGGAILRNFGILGVLGMIFAYWLLGNIYGAVIPVLSLILFAILFRIWDAYKMKRSIDKFNNGEDDD